MSAAAEVFGRARRELVAARHVPYSALVAPEVLRTAQGDLVQTLRVGGMAFESADDESVNAWHERLNALWRNVASPHVALWVHVIRRREQAYPAGEFPPGFARELNERYRARLAGERLMVNELYVTLVYRPQPTAVGAAALRLFGRPDSAVARAELADALEACSKLRAQVLAGLAAYEPELLGVAADAGGRPRSALLGFLGQLLNGERQEFPLPTAPVAEALATSRLLFGREVLEYRTPTATRLGAFLGIKEYPTPSSPGMLNRLLTAPFPLVLTQSFTFLPKSTAQALLSRQFHRLTNAGDLAVSQAAELKQALDQLSSNEFVMGDHHWSLQVLTEPVAAEDGEAVAAAVRALNEAVALARTWCGETGMVVAREDLALEAAFWAQLPGNFAFRPRKAPITSRNFAGLAPLHNFPVGRATGNHWGAALAMFATSARSPYYFSLHASDPREADGGSRRDTGHTFICGPTGSGKTVFLGFCVAMLARHGATQVIFDKDRGLEILVRALGGSYRALRLGEPTGFNPLALPDSPAQREFLRGWLRALVARPERPLTVREEADLEQALAGTLALAPASRRLSRLVEFLDPTDLEGVHARLARWCAAHDGEHAWVFDGEEAHPAGWLGDGAVAGFDVTAFLDYPQLRTPITLYLFHRVRQALDGRRLVVWMDEFAKLLADPAFEGFARDGLKTWRKLNAVAAFATQSPSDVLASPIARTLVEQTPTKVLFPNLEAQRAEYVEGFGLAEREYALIARELTPGSRRFLLRQGVQGVVCELDLKGFDFELDVISGRARNVQLVERLIEEHGEAPEDWLPVFRDERASAGQSPLSVGARPPGHARSTSL
jgi:type IV secretion system protein VirB4